MVRIGTTWWVAAAGIAWAALSAWLCAEGHAPSRPPPWSDANHYVWQSLLALPVVWLQWRILARVAHAVGKPDVRSQTTGAAVAAPFAMPLIIALLLPDAVLYAGWGFDAMGQGVRLYGPIALLWSAAWTHWELRRLRGMTGWRAAFGTLAGQTAAWAFGSLLLR